MNTQSIPALPHSCSDACVCYHCGQPLPRGAALKVEIDGTAQPMCCRGCQAVAEAIVVSGLVDYYRYRTNPVPTARELVPAFLRQTAVYDNPAVQKTFVQNVDGNVREASLILEGMVCAACVWLNEQHLAKLPGVLAVSINYATHRARVRWDDAQVHLSRILRAVSEIGYLAHPYDPGRAQEILERERRLQLRRLAVAAAFGMQVMILAVALYAGAFTGIETEFKNLFHWLSLVLTLPVLGYSAQPFFRSAYRDLRQKRVGMDVPVSLGLSLAFAGSVWATVTGHGEVYYDSVVMFVFFLLTGRTFELAGRKRAAEVSEALVHMLPVTATRLVNGKQEAVPASELNGGDLVLVRPGESIPADGHVHEGRSSVDESLLTGESLPLAKTPGDILIGGSINIESPLILRVEKTGEDTVLSAILRLLDRAQTEKPAIAAAADRAAAWFVARVLLLAAGVALFWYLYDPARWLPITIAVLVVTCPCALSLATPTAITAATGRLMRRGLVTTRGHALETLARANTFVFDKTGTLTYGRLTLLDTHTYTPLGASDCLALAAALEQHSEHPIARALRATVDELRHTATDVASTPGAGLSGAINSQRYFLGTAAFLQEAAGVRTQDDALAALRAGGNTLVLLSDTRQLLAAFVIGDEVRAGAKTLITELQRHGKRVLLLTGDHPGAAERVARETGIREVEADLLPQDKLARVHALADQGAIVAMVGDGVNDAAALAAAHVSVAMGGGTQIAAASADMILLSEHLPHLAEAVLVAGKTLRVIRQNMAWAVGYNLIALPFAAFGLVAPWMAALGMSASSLIVVANALRLSERTARAAPCADAR
ncbi:MAG: heavy metal translocating P-type ATPase, partial [Pseudomonadota bacterium]